MHAERPYARPIPFRFLETLAVVFPDQASLITRNSGRARHANVEEKRRRRRVKKGEREKYCQKPRLSMCPLDGIAESDGRADGRSRIYIFIKTPTARPRRGAPWAPLKACRGVIKHSGKKKISLFANHTNTFQNFDLLLSGSYSPPRSPRIAFLTDSSPDDDGSSPVRVSLSPTPPSREPS